MVLIILKNNCINIKKILKIKYLFLKYILKHKKQIKNISNPHANLYWKTFSKQTLKFLILKDNLLSFALIPI